MSIRILLADDHKITRQGLRSLLDKQQDMEVEAESRYLNKRSGHYRVTALMRYITAVFMTICLLNVCVAGAQPENGHNVLVLNSYHRGYDWSDRIMDLRSGVYQGRRVARSHDGSHGLQVRQATRVFR